MTITGMALLIAAGSVNDEFRILQAGGDATREQLEVLSERGQSYQVSGAVLLGLGTAVLAAGVVMVVLARRRARASAFISPMVSAGGGGFALSGVF